MAGKQRRTIDRDERRARLGVRHHLVAPVDDVDEAAANLVGLHSSDPVTVYLAARARVDRFQRSDLVRAVYEQRSLVRMLGMRQTLFVVPRDLAAVMKAACALRYRAAERSRLVRMLEEQNLAAEAAPWIDRVASDVLDALAHRGEATAVELTKDVPELALKITFGDGTKWGGAVGVSTRILFLLATEGRIVRARPRGTWISSQYRWALTDRWLGSPLPDLEINEASADLVARWLRTFGPGTLTDIKWWTGWTVRQTRAALEAVAAVEVDLDEGVGYVLPDDLDPVVAPPDWVALLPGLDPTVMGWKERAWYLGDHHKQLFDRNGNAGPTVWWNGRIVGGWAQRSDGVVVRLLDDVPGSVAQRVAVEAIRVTEWLGDSVVTPRFRAPLERELATAP